MSPKPPRRRPGASSGLVPLVEPIAVPGGDPTTPRAALAIDVDRVAPNPLNRRVVDARPDALAELADSMRQHGQLQACVAVTVGAFVAAFPEREDDVAGADYVQVVGARRRAAVLLAGLSTLDIVVRDTLADDRAAFVAATAAENIFRTNLDPVEEAEQVQLQVAESGTQAAAAGHLRRTPAWVTQRLNLLKLVPELQSALRTAEIPVAEVRDLHRATPAEQLAALRRWRAQAARREQRGEQGDQPKPARPPRDAVAVQRAVKDPTKTLASWRAALPADDLRGVMTGLRALLDEYDRDA